MSDNQENEMKKIDPKLLAGMDKYAKHLEADYPHNYPGSRYEISFEFGRYFARVVANSGKDSRSSHSWVCIKDHPKGFVVGDILKSASWKAPALNYKRGTIFNPKSYAGVKWTGAMGC